MKKLPAFFLSLAMLLPAATALAAEYEFTLNLPIPPVHTRWANAIKPWFEELEQRSGGRIKVEPFFAEALSKQSESFDSLRNGLADFAESSYMAAAGSFPFHESFPDLVDPSRSVDFPTDTLRALEEEFPALNEETKGAKILFSHCSPMGMLIGTKKEVSSLAELKGMKIASIGGPATAAKLKALGAAPVFIPGSDLYMALQQGIVDGLTCDFQLLVSRRLGDIVKHVLPVAMATSNFYLAMNNEAFNSLPVDLQAVITDMSGEYGREKFKKAWMNDQYNNAKAWKEQMGGKLHLLSDADYVQVHTLIQPVIEESVRAMNAAGLPGDAVYKRFAQLQVEKDALWKDSWLIKDFGGN